MIARSTPYLLFVVLLIVGCRSDSATDKTANDRDRTVAQVHPIVDASEEQLFGASRDGEWLTGVEAAEYVQPDQRFRLYRLTDTLGTGRAADPEPAGETCMNPTVRMRGVPDHGGDIMAVAGDWNALPRVPAVMDTTQAIYKNVVGDHLQHQGIAAAVSLDQVLRVDLDGDGVDEVLIAANRLRGSETSALSGDHALVLLRKLVDGEVREIVLEEEYYPEECIATCAPSSYRIAAVLDLNGDGVMEVITDFQYFEGRGKNVHAINGEEADRVLSWRCGA